jgi:hypothetical protein
LLRPADHHTVERLLTKGDPPPSLIAFPLLGYLIGRWGLPLARPVPLYMVSGVPIPVKKVAKDSPEFDAEVDRVHAQVGIGQRTMQDHILMPCTAIYCVSYAGPSAGTFVMGRVGQFQL